MKESLSRCVAWFGTVEGAPGGESVCGTRDQFEGRLDGLYEELLRETGSSTEMALLTAVAGEIGNNCFDHNLGQWRDVPGCWFEYGTDGGRLWVLIADRGQGVRSSLRRVMPHLKDDGDALEAAFHLRVSGRSPERRGNGLKFVRDVLNGSGHRGIYFVSGSAFRIFGWAPPLQEAVAGLERPVRGGGTLALLVWRGRR